MMERLKISRLALLCGCTFVFAITPANAQNADTSTRAASTSDADADTSRIQDIIVTGSRVVRDGYNQPTPVTVAPTAELQKATPTNLADALNKLPQFANSVSPAANTQLQGNSGEHGNLLNLRGVGPTRALILLDGIRVPPTTFRGAVDVNTIPQLLIQRVDVVTGGASAVYGSDAVSGAVNFVLEKKFEGLKGVAQRGISTRGDLGNYRVGLAGGLGFAGGRGHVIASLERFSSEGIKRSARIYGDDAYAAVGSVVGSTDAPGRAGNPFIFLPNLRFATNDFNNGIILTSTVPSLANSIFLPGGAVRPFQRGAPTGTPGTNVGGDGLYIPGSNQLIAPLTTTQGYGQLSYDLTETLTAHAQGSYSRSVTSYDTQAQSVLGFRFFSGNAFLDPSVQARLGPNDSFTVFRFIDEQGPIPTNEATNAYLVNGGLEWQLGGWNVTADYTHGNSVTKFAQTQIEIPKLAAALDAVRAPNGSIVCRVTLTNPGLYPGCVPINVFGAGTPTTDALQTVLGVSRYRASNTTDDFVVSARGDLVELPAGVVTVAIGAQYRRQKLNLTSNSDPSVAIDFTGLRGIPANRMTRFNNTNVGSAFGKLNVKEAFAEAQVPIFKGQPFAEELSLNGAFRLTDYSTSGSVNTWKIGAVYKPVQDIMFRVTRSRDIRAPSLFELFAGIQTAPVNFNDPHTGTPGSIRQFSGGNPDLTPETGDTFAAGIVLSPSFFSGFNASIDYYDLKIDGAIATQGLNDVVNECETSGGTSPTCSLIDRPLPFSDRSPANYPTSVSLITQNISVLKTSGIDVALSYRMSVGSGEVTLRGSMNYLRRYISQTNSVAPVIDYAGHGVNSQTGYAFPKVRSTISINYANGGFTAFAQESIIGKVKIGNLENDPTTSYAVPAVKPVFYTDATLSYKFDTAGSPELFLTATNLFDRKPPLVAAAAAPGLLYPTLFTLYDVGGRTMTAGVRFRF
ncbi:TonB-dependent receptor plug domain-containing protein [Sphingomonas sanxanigenens]|uniref:TonB-dependent receptor plug domain-containing protein n=1 Tax=Sphingomonas sanxanigenens TaxID=397260 RepID=UPI00046D27CC|nr:TonB-dependent receptor [Sphingomonas sanxanigenens]